MTKQSQRRKGAKRNNVNRGNRSMIPRPPQLPSYGITRDVRLRFECFNNGPFDGQITYHNLLDTVLIATGATTGVDLFDAVRINSIEAWAIASVGTAATITLSFDGLTTGAVGDRKTHTDTSMGLEPAHIRAKPDPETQAGQFQPANSNNAFLLSCPVNTIIDVSMTLRQPVQGTVVAVANALVAATTGAIYYRGLDGVAASASQLPVLGAIAVQ